MGMRILSMRVPPRVKRLPVKSLHMGEYRQKYLFINEPGLYIAKPTFERRRRQYEQVPTRGPCKAGGLAFEFGNPLRQARRARFSSLRGTLFGGPFPGSVR